MASNFKILIKRYEDHIHLRLYGDFDGSSAHELINLLKQYGHSASKIHIYTDGLNQVHTFGLRIFNKRLRIMKDYTHRIAFSGNPARVFANQSENISD